MVQGHFTVAETGEGRGLLTQANLFPLSSAEASDVIFGAALAAALAGHA